jgi:hypothetical protein
LALFILQFLQTVKLVHDILSLAISFGPYFDYNITVLPMNPWEEGECALGKPSSQ